MEEMIFGLAEAHLFFNDLEVTDILEITKILFFKFEFTRNVTKSISMTSPMKITASI